MPKETQPRLSNPQPTTPTEYAITPPPHSLSALDHSFLLQMMTDLTGKVARLTESVDNLKDQVKEQGKKLDEVRVDVLNAKAALGTLKWVGRVIMAGILTCAALLGWFITTVIGLIGHGKP